MKKSIFLLVTLIALVGVVPAALANPLTLKISNGAGTAVTVTGNDLIVWAGSVGNFDFNVTIGAQGVPGDDFMHLSSLNISSANASSDPLTIEFTAENLTTPTDSFQMAIGGVLSPAGATGTYQAFYNSTLIGLIGFDGTTNSGAFNYNFNGAGPGSTPYSLTQKITLNANGASQLSFSGGATLNPVPEPSIIVLMGSGLFGLVFVGYRRSKAMWSA